MDDDRVRRQMRRYVAVLAIPFVLYVAWLVASSAGEGGLGVAVDRWSPAVAGGVVGVATVAIWRRRR